MDLINSTNTTKSVIISASMLAADFGELRNYAKRAIDWGAETLHIDIMDGGNFTNCFGFSEYAVGAMADVGVPLDVHFMTMDSSRSYKKFVDAGASSITFQIELESQVHRCLSIIKKLNVKAGIALCPATPVCMLENILELLDMITIMSIDPGTAGSAFIPNSYTKIKTIYDMVSEKGLPIEISVDGGVNIQNAHKCIQNGADKLIIGSSLFKSEDPQKIICQIKERQS